MSSTTPSEFYFFITNHSWGNTLINRLDSKKSCGYDDAPVRALKVAKYLLVTLLSNVTNEMHMWRPLAARMYALRNWITPSFHDIFSYFVFRWVYCFGLIFNFAWTRTLDNVSSLRKTLCTKLNIRHLIVFAWEAQALQMINVWSSRTCERLQRRHVAIEKCRKSCGLPVKQSQPGTASLELWYPQSRVAGWSGLWQVAESMCLSYSSAGKRQRTYNCRLWSFTMYRDMIHCIKLTIRLTWSDYVWYVFSF